MHPYIAANRLSKAFGSKQVLRGVTAEVGPGEIIGLLGKNGAGKTTLLELILGFTAPSTGEVRVFGRDSFRMPSEVKARIGFVPQQDELIEQLTGADQLALIGSFYGNWDGAFMRALSARWEVDLNDRVKDMSVGQRQKLSIMLALGHHPELLVLDEPVASLDPIARRQFLEQIIDVTAEGHCSVVFSSHIVSDVERLASRVWILQDGGIGWLGGIDTLKESVVRVRLHSNAPLPEDLGLSGVLSIDRSEREAAAIVRDWRDSHRSQLAARTGAAIAVESLSLEEIFLEMHG